MRLSLLRRFWVVKMTQQIYYTDYTEQRFKVVSCNHKRGDPPGMGVAVSDGARDDAPAVRP
jgi:hypothetical protein